MFDVGDDHVLLAAARITVESRFKAVRSYGTVEVHVSPLGLANLKGHATEPPKAMAMTSKVYPFAPITGKGPSAKSAIFDWLINVGAQIGGLSEGLLWRQEPELDCERNLETDAILFKVYSRLAAC